MAIDPEFGRRLRLAKREWETRHDRALPNKELAERVRDVAGVESLSGQAVGQWLNDGQEPGSLALLRAVAQVLEVPVQRLVEDEAPRRPLHGETGLPDVREELARNHAARTRPTVKKGRRA